MKNIDKYAKTKLYFTFEDDDEFTKLVVEEQVINKGLLEVASFTVERSDYSQTDLLRKYTTWLGEEYAILTSDEKFYISNIVSQFREVDNVIISKEYNTSNQYLSLRISYKDNREDSIINLPYLSNYKNILFNGLELCHEYDCESLGISLVGNVNEKY